METSGIFGVIGVVLGYVLRPLGDWVRDKAVSRQERAQRRADFRRDTLLNLQQALFDVDRAVAEIRQFGIVLPGPGGTPKDRLRDAQNRVNMYRVRLEDDELIDAVKLFDLGAMKLATSLPSLPQDELIAAVALKQAGLDRANERIGVLLRALH